MLLKIYFVEQLQQNMLSKYEVLEKVGSGNFSTVHLVKNIENQQTAAMKVMKTHQSIGLKQAYLLKSFDHPNIIKLLDFEQDTARNQTKMVLEYWPQNTLQLYESQKYGLRQQQVKCILFQAALGLAYIHDRGIIHRDIKPQNILIDKKKAEIKLIDFGLAIAVDKISTDYVATRWYRAPQNLLGSKEYTCAIDIFSLACVVVELYLGSPLFPGTNNIDQLHRIFNILGEPTESNWPIGYRCFRLQGIKVERSKTNDQQLKSKSFQSFGLRSLLKSCSQGLIQLIEKMLHLNPKKRITSRQIIHDKYFGEIRHIIPPHIYKRFEKDYLQKLSPPNSKDVLQSAEHYLHMAKERLGKNIKIKTENSPLEQINNYSIHPSRVQTKNNNSDDFLLLNQPKNNSKIFQLKNVPQNKNIYEHSLSPSMISNGLKESQMSGLSFRGLPNLKNPKLSIKDNLKKAGKSPDLNFRQRIKKEQRQSRNHSIDNTQKPKIIKQLSNSIEINKKIINGIFDPNRIDLRPFRSIEAQKNNVNSNNNSFLKNQKSLQKNTLVYYYNPNQFQTNQSHLSPMKGTQNLNPLNKSIQIPLKRQQVSIIQNQASVQIKNSVVYQNSRSPRSNTKIDIPFNSSLVQPGINLHRKVSNSPSGIMLTQLKNQSSDNQIAKNASYNEQRDRSTQQQSIYTSNRVMQKLRLITNVKPAPIGRLRKQESYKQQQMPSSIIKDSSITQVNKSRNISEISYITQSQQANPMLSKYNSTINIHQPIATNRQMVENSPDYSIKRFGQSNQRSNANQFKSLKHKDQVKFTKNQFANNADDRKQSIRQCQVKQSQNFKNVVIDKKEYRQPRIAVKKFMNMEGNQRENQNLQKSFFSHLMPKQQSRNININLNLNIVDAENKTYRNYENFHRN